MDGIGEIERPERGQPDTIAAVATGPGAGAVGVVRVAGPLAGCIARAVIGKVPEPQRVCCTYFYGADGSRIDQGLAIYFRGPRSFTGDDILELQGHGGPVVLNLLLGRVTALGARLARPGEFAQRAFLNGKLDLTRAEAIADLIAASTASAARLAARTLEGVFARRVEGLAEQMIDLRSLIEAGLDFAEEDDIEALSDGVIAERLVALQRELERLCESAEHGRVYHEGLRIVIAGPPNAGKSSLLNALTETDRAIVTEVPGTTRDVLHEEIQLGGVPIELVDTAGIRPSGDPIETEGVRRAERAVAEAEQVLWLIDDAVSPQGKPPATLATLPAGGVTLVRNKIDLSGRPAAVRETNQGVEIAISVRTGAGLDLLKERIRVAAGLAAPSEGQFLARRRHVEALEQARALLGSASRAFAARRPPELIAEDLRLGQRALAEITGAVTSEDLLDRIFSRFCIGK